jgi:beta-glucosidase
MTAKEVGQLYIRPVAPTVYRPDQELKGFEKILLEPGERKTITLDLDERAFAFYDIGVKDWIVEQGGSYELRVGASSRDIRLKRTIIFAKGMSSSQLARETYPPIRPEVATDDIVFSKRFGQDQDKVLDCIRQGKESNLDYRIHRNSLLKEVATLSILGNILFKIILRIGCREVKPGPSEKREIRMLRANIENLPLRAIVLFSKGGLSLEFLDLLISAMNVSLWKAIAGLISDFWNSILDILARSFGR